MAVLRFDPVRSFESLAKKMGDIVNEFDKGVSVEFGSFAPRVDILEDEKKLYLYAELPGINKDDVKVTINDENILLIKGEKRRVYNEKENGKNQIRSERNFGEFSRSFMLTDNINIESIQAQFENGVLSIILDKKEPEKPKEHNIPIS